MSVSREAGHEVGVVPAVSGVRADRFAHRGGPSIAAAIGCDLAATRAHAGNRDLIEEPSAAELAALRASRLVSPDAKSGRSSTSR